MYENVLDPYFLSRTNIEKKIMTKSQIFIYLMIGKLSIVCKYIPVSFKGSSRKKYTTCAQTAGLSEPG